MKNKIFALLLSFCTLFTLFSPIPTFAITLNDGIYINSLECPKEFISYVEEESTDIALQAMALDSSITQATEITIGQPFSFMNTGSDVFYFPLNYKDETKFIFRVYIYNGQLNGILSSVLAKEINAMQNNSSEQSPISIYEDEGKILATDGDNENILYEYPEDYKETKSVDLISENKSTTVDLLETLDIDLEYDKIESRNTLRVPFTYRLINTKDIVEQQTTLPWCGGYITTAILRSLGINVKVQDMGNFFKQSQFEAFSWESLINYPAHYGYKPTLIHKTISNQEYMTQMRKGSSIMLSLYRPDGAGHALMGLGYQQPHGNYIYVNYIVWNPWYNTFETIYGTNNAYGKPVTYIPYTTSGNDNTFTWTSTIYNYK